jgi:PAS domain-containing protein
VTEASRGELAGELDDFSYRPGPTIWLRYFVAIVITVAALLVTHTFDTFRVKQSFLPVTAAITITAWFGGLLPSLLAIVIASVGWAWFISPPFDSIRIENLSDLMRLGLFVFVALLISSLHAARERAEIAARQAQQRLTLALEAARMGVWDFDVRSGEFWGSDGLRSLVGRHDEDFATTYAAFLSYTHPQDREMVVRAMTRTIQKGQSQIEHRVVGGDGAVRTVNSRGRCLIGDDGQPERIIGVMIDVSDTKTIGKAQS